MAEQASTRAVAAAVAVRTCSLQLLMNAVVEATAWAAAPGASCIMEMTAPPLEALELNLHWKSHKSLYEMCWHWHS
jgi:hypothetical protein